MKRSKQIHCPQCKKQIQSEHLDIFSEIAECIECNIKFSLRKDARNLKEYNILDNTSFANLNQEDLKKYTIHYSKNESGEEIVIPCIKVSGYNVLGLQFVMSFFFIICLIFFIVITSSMHSDDPDYVLILFPGFFLGIPMLILSYFGVIPLVSNFLSNYHYKIELSTFSFGRISPFSKSMRTVDIDNIKKIEVEFSNISINGTTPFYLALHTMNGTKHKLTKISGNNIQLKILGHLLERLLKINERITKMANKE